MPPRGSLVLVDTVAIKAAHELGCWNALRQAYHLETVEKCLEEVIRPDRAGRQLVPRKGAELKTELKVHAVSDLQRTKLLLLLGKQIDLDDGERDLLAHALTLGRKAWWLCGPDKATLRALHRLNLLERMVALETMARAAGHRIVTLGEQHTEQWLKAKRTKLLLGEEFI
jgi:hypothetical protein